MYNHEEVYHAISDAHRDGFEHKPLSIEKRMESLTKENNKVSVEFNRYKQDCRKRALEMAHLEFPDKSKTDINANVIDAADKYYNWLISIPEN